MNKLLIKLGIIKEEKPTLDVGYKQDDEILIRRALDLYRGICDTGFKNKGGANAHKAIKHKAQ